MRPRRWPLVSVSAPGALLGLTWLTTLILAGGGIPAPWRTDPLNLAEAAALRDGGTVAALMSNGADPSRIYVVRAGFLFERAARLTPLDAAVAAGRPEILQLLIDGGLAMEASDWSRAWCSGDEGVRQVLEGVRPAGDVAPCAGAAAADVRR